MDGLQDVLAVLSGSVVGFSLGLIGGGGSMLAVPLLLYVVGVETPHFAIGTSALAVSVSAFLNLLGHWWRGAVKWPCALVFAAAGTAGAVLGSSLGKTVDGEQLIFLFAFVMIAVGITMLRPRTAPTNPEVRLTPRIAGLMAAIGLAVGVIAGFFGIGGGFLIVPGLVLGTGMPLLNAIASSLAVVTALGATTAANYALSGLIDWSIAFEFIAGGVVGGLFGRMAAVRLSMHKDMLNRLIAGVIFAVAAYMLVRGGAVLFGA